MVLPIVGARGGAAFPATTQTGSSASRPSHPVAAMPGIAAASVDRRACLSQLSNLTKCLRIVQDLPAIDALSRIELELPAELDLGADGGIREVLHQRATLQCAVSLEEVQRPVEAWTVVSAGLRDVALAYAAAIDTFAAQVRDHRLNGRPHPDPVFLSPGPTADGPRPPGLQILAYLLGHRKKYRNPALAALRRDRPDLRFDQRTFDFAWTIVFSPPHLRALEMLQLNTRQRVPLNAWGTLDAMVDHTAEAMCALRDWQYASYSDGPFLADEPCCPTPIPRARHPLFATPEDLCAISLFVYPACPIARPVIVLED